MLSEFVKFVSMKIGILNHIVDSDHSFTKSIKHTRAILLAGLIMYSVFGFLDIYMLPKTYIIAWIVRFGIVGPATTIFYFSTYSKWFFRYGKLWLSTLIIIAQLGIVTILFAAQPDEGGYLGYYAGLILITLWGSLIFRLSIPDIIFTAITNLVFYNIVAIGFQKLYLYPAHSLEFGSLLNNNLFLLASSIIAFYGAYQINIYKKDLRTHNILLKTEKQALRKAKVKAEESDKLKSAFLANMSHEIRTPMNAILGFSELLKKPALDIKKKNDYLNIIQSKGNQLLHLINDIIDISSIEANHTIIKQELVNLNGLCDELLTTYRRLLDNSGKKQLVRLIFQMTMPDNDSWISTDPTRLKQILSNLLDNALKFTAKGEIIFGYKIDENMIQFYVKDTGIGIPIEMQEVVFERFHQINNDELGSFGGIGLGLSIVKRLVELMGGKIWLISNPAHGSKFYFTIQYVPVQYQKNEIFEPQTFDNELNWKGRTILLAEDNDENYLYLSELLKETEVTIIRTQDGQETVDVALMSNEIDLILLDIKLPILNGYEVAKKIKSVKKHIPIIAQTAYAMEEDKKKVLDSNCNDYIFKPIRSQDILNLISKYLD